MLRAWYGVISTGNQAGYKLDQLAELGKYEFSAIKSCLDRNRYVNDIGWAQHTGRQRTTNISGTGVIIKSRFFSKIYCKE